MILVFAPTMLEENHVVNVRTIRAKQRAVPNVSRWWLQRISREYAAKRDMAGTRGAKIKPKRSVMVEAAQVAMVPPVGITTIV